MWARVVSWLKGLTRRSTLERELDDELAFHLRARTEHWRQRGLPADEAYRRARLEFGAADATRERCREARGLRLVDEARADVRFAVRLMRRSPVLTAVAVSTLALAIGANTAIFSLLNAALLKTLPVSHPESLRMLEWSSPRLSAWYNGESHEGEGGVEVRTSFPYPAYVQIRDRARSFASVVAFSPINEVNLNGGAGAELGSALFVSGNFFSGLGIGAAAGRTLTPDDDRPAAPAAVVLSHGYWQRSFGGEPGAVGRTIAVNGVAATIVGVAPRGFCGVRPGRCVDLLAPIATLQNPVFGVPDLLTSARRWGFPVIARLAPGVDGRAAAAEAEAIVRQVVAADPPEMLPYDPPRVTLAPGGRGLDDLRRNLAKPLNLLMGVVVAVLLIACANIAGLLLTQASARRHELSTRLALGAGRTRLARQLMTESLLLALMGGVMGVALALALRGLLPYALARGGEPMQLDVALDWRMLTFSLVVCMLAGICCGLLPALTGSRVTLLPAVARGAPAADSLRSRLWTGKALVVAQVALSLMLVTTASLFVRTLLNLRSEALGFKPDHLLLFQMDATLSGYKDQRVLDFYEAALERVRATPGVRIASMSRWGLISDSATGDTIVTARDSASSSTDRDVRIHYVAADYFRTMGIPLLAGRDVTPADREQAPKVAIINESLARRSFTGLAVGERFGMGGDSTANEIEIVGLAADARFSSLRELAPPTVYIPYRQNSQHVMTIAVRTDLEPTTLVEPLRQTLARLDANVPLSEIRTQEAQIERSIGQERLFARLLSAFALAGVLLAALGIYGTLAYSASRRTAEIGVRLALGAERRAIVRMVAGDMAVPVAAGVVLGLVGSFASTRTLESLLFGLTARDATALATAAVVLCVSAVLAAWLPARRAARVDPVVALREH
jgi:predicted permease